jgi:predicted alpha/beta hydrolase family esterase
MATRSLIDHMCGNRKRPDSSLASTVWRTLHHFRRKFETRLAFFVLVLMVPIVPILGAAMVPTVLYAQGTVLTQTTYTLQDGKADHDDWSHGTTILINGMRSFLRLYRQKLAEKFGDPVAELATVMAKDSSLAFRKHQLVLAEYETCAETESVKARVDPRTVNPRIRAKFGKLVVRSPEGNDEQLSDALDKGRAFTDRIFEAAYQATAMGVDPADDAKVEMLIEDYVQHGQRITQAIADDLAGVSPTEQAPNTVGMGKILAFTFGIALVLILLFMWLNRRQTPVAASLSAFELHSIRECSADTAVVFVHGILSSGEEAWGQPSWPDLLAAELEFDGVGIFVLTYQTGMWSRTYAIADVADFLREHLRNRGLLHKPKIVFVCHSMGGIVVRRFLVANQRALIATKSIIGLFLVASPSLGSRDANMLSILSFALPHTQAAALRFSQANTSLDELDRDFWALLNGGELQIEGRELTEDRPIAVKRWLGMWRQVVEPFAACRYFHKPGCEPFRVPGSDHRSIIKPLRSGAIQHLMLKKFILEFICPYDSDQDCSDSAGAFMAAVKAAVARFASKNATPDDEQILRRAGREGTLVIAGGQRSVSVGGDASGAPIIFGDVYVRIGEGTPLGERLRDLLFPLRPGRLPPRPDLVIGRAEAFSEIRHRLGDHGGSVNRTVLAGWPGVGKTTLVAAIAYDADIGQMFPDGVLWTWLGPRPTGSRILSELGAWGDAVGLGDLSASTLVQHAVDKLAPRLRATRMLLIIDDVWEPSQAKPFLDCAGPRCEVIITTRQPGVARALSTTSAAEYPVPSLAERDGLILMRLIAPDVVAEKPDHCLELVRALGCLPLALRVAAGLLAAEEKMGWGVDDLLLRLHDGAEVIKATAPADRADLETQTTPTVAALLQQSVDVLDNNTQRYFALLGAFPAGESFGVDAVAALWKVADPRPILRELASRGLIEPTGGRFRMHQLLFALARTSFDHLS